MQAKAYVKAPKETDVMPRFRTVKRRDQEKGRGKIQNCQENGCQEQEMSSGSGDRRRCQDKKMSIRKRRPVKEVAPERVATCCNEKGMSREKSFQEEEMSTDKRHQQS